MKNKLLLLAAAIMLTISACTQQSSTPKQDSPVNNIDKTTVEKTINMLAADAQDADRLARGVAQAAALWTTADGSAEEFGEFCKNYYINDPEQLDKTFDRLSHNFEVIQGHYMKINVDLNVPLHLTVGEVLPVDHIFGAFSPFAHFQDDFFTNKIAFITALNFPFYTLQEKQELGGNWTRKQWAYARLGDMFISRVPAAVAQKISDKMTSSDNYISNYNIYAGYLTDESGERFFPEDMKLISHWNLRDELKSQYSDKEKGLYRQQMIYEVMKNIISQDIPQSVINSNKYTWDPFKNKVFEGKKEIKAEREPDTRYQHLLDNFRARYEADKYNPNYPTYIQRAFDQNMELSQAEVEKMFRDFVSSPIAKQVGELIKKRLGRDLQPFDIWYDGFKARSSIDEGKLNEITMNKWKNTEDFQNELPVILEKLGFSKEKSAFIASKVQVDPSRGAGHAWGAEMKSELAHLRTRIGSGGMNYKGYNIATHEFGHNTEQTLTLHDVDYYMMHGVPNTAFTEAWAFVFQKRDLELLGMKEENPNKNYLMALDNFWSSYEIMGVSLLDMEVWKWLYNNPDCTPQQLKEAVISSAKDIWNQYYAPVFGMKDQPILAIYSHMIDNPLYLSAYPVGHLIEFQLEQYIEGKNLGTEMQRICAQGRLAPQEWMKQAVGSELSIQPSLDAAAEALKHITE